MRVRRMKRSLHTRDRRDRYSARRAPIYCIRNRLEPGEAMFLNNYAICTPLGIRVRGDPL